MAQSSLAINSAGQLSSDLAPSILTAEFFNRTPISKARFALRSSDRFLVSGRNLLEKIVCSLFFRVASLLHFTFRIGGLIESLVRLLRGSSAVTTEKRSLIFHQGVALVGAVAGLVHYCSRLGFFSLGLSALPLKIISSVSIGASSILLLDGFVAHLFTPDHLEATLGRKVYTWMLIAATVAAMAASVFAFLTLFSVHPALVMGNFFFTGVTVILDLTGGVCGFFWGF